METDALLLVVCRRADLVGLGLGEANVDCQPNEIKIDRNLCTSQGHIYAAGDCAEDFNSHTMLAIKG